LFPNTGSDGLLWSAAAANIGFFGTLDSAQLKERVGEFIMEPDVFIVLSLALLFFGGVGYLVWKERNSQNVQISDPPASREDNTRRTEKRKKRTRR
jgi:hypothetical protein